MNEPINRRTALKLIAAATVVGAASGLRSNAANHPSPGPEARDPWRRSHDRVFLGGAFWANPMEDWRIADGGAECQSLGGNRSIHSLTHQITSPTKGFSMSVQLSQLEVQGNDAGAGFRLGVRSELNEYRSNCFVARGINAGVGLAGFERQRDFGPAGDAVEDEIDLLLAGTGR